MRSYSFPAKYRPYVEAELALALAAIGRDVACRSDADARVRALARVPDAQIDGDAEGTISVLVMESETMAAAVAPLPDLIDTAVLRGRVVAPSSALPVNN